MKSLTILLTFTILFLSVKSGVNGISLQANVDTTCCGSLCTPLAENDSLENHEQKGDCKGNSCNPFQACCSCFLFYITTPTFTIHKKTYITTKQFFNYKSLIISQYASDFWQPPKFV